MESKTVKTKTINDHSEHAQTKMIANPLPLYEYKPLYMKPSLRPDDTKPTSNRLALDIQKGEYKPPELYEDEKWKDNDADVLNKIKQIRELLEMSKKATPMSVYAQKELLQIQHNRKKYIATLESMQKKLKDIEYKYFTLPSIINHTIKLPKGKKNRSAQTKQPTKKNEFEDDEEDEDKEIPERKIELKPYQDVFEEIKQHVIKKYTGNTSNDIHDFWKHKHIRKKTESNTPDHNPTKRVKTHYSKTQEQQQRKTENKLKKKIDTIFYKNKPPIKYKKNIPTAELIQKLNKLKTEQHP